ncbi:MAG TPA: histidine phosphatase family protein [Burkholderiaceae bacterium]|nr:histidine phosphatase family protein [Burkholderiaceae bacterium]
MDLILWRHAEAVDATEGINDLERPLTPKGERQAKRVADWLNQVLPATTRILVSPARRTQQTAQALERKFKTVDALGPGREVRDLLAAARWSESREPVLVVGHQPTLGVTAALLVGEIEPGAAEPWRIKKAGVWWLRSRDPEEGEASVTVVTVRSPDML